MHDLKKTLTKKGDAWWACLRHHVSHYNVIGDTREGASQIYLPKNKKGAHDTVTAETMATTPNRPTGL
jgi:galactose mutarotase-like enzyme